MGELKTLVTKLESDVMHVPEELREMLGPDTKLIVGTAAVVAFSAGTSYADILRSIELIHDDVQLRVAKEESQNKRQGKKPVRHALRRTSSRIK